MGEPLRHHFLPKFYLKQWSGDDGRLVEFSQPYGHIVKPRRVHPKATGFVHRLYAVEGMPDEIAQEMEKTFLSPVDSRAAEAMRAMLLGVEFTSRDRMAWAAFLATLLARMPEDIRHMRQMVSGLFESLFPSLERFFEPVSRIDSSLTFSRFVEEGRERLGAKSIDHLRRHMSHDTLVQGLAAMEWSVLALDNSKHQLMTSDRPVVHTDEFGHDSSHLVLPIGPSHLFIAAKRRDIIAKIKAVGSDKIAYATNAAVVGGADRLVYGRTDAQLRFVQNRIGRQRSTTIMQRMVSMSEEQAHLIRAAFEEAM